MRFWTADLHLGHSNVIQYCGRPFSDCHHMNKWMLNEADMRIKSADTCVCAGDFCIRGGQKARDWLKRLTGTWVFVRGNHDKNNGVKAACRWMVCDVGPYRVFVSHVPYFYSDPDDRCAQYHIGPGLIEWVESNCDFAVCGHVHEKWSISTSGKIPTINVGVDVRNYRSMSDVELITEYTQHKMGQEGRKDNAQRHEEIRQGVVAEDARQERS